MDVNLMICFLLRDLAARDLFIGFFPEILQAICQAFKLFIDKKVNSAGRIITLLIFYARRLSG